MKLASLKGGRDGRLVVVSDDLSSYTDAGAIAPTLQAALDAWATTSPRLEALSRDLASGAVAGQVFDPGNAAAPLPRAYQWADGSAYVNHDDEAGVLAPGMRADLAVVDRDPFDRSLGPIGETTTQLTIAGGQVVFDRTAS